MLNIILIYMQRQILELTFATCAVIIIKKYVPVQFHNMSGSVYNRVHGT